MEALPPEIVRHMFMFIALADDRRAARCVSHGWRALMLELLRSPADWARCLAIEQTRTEGGVVSLYAIRHTLWHMGAPDGLRWTISTSGQAARTALLRVSFARNASVLFRTPLDAVSIKVDDDQLECVSEASSHFRLSLGGTSQDYYVKHRLAYRPFQHVAYYIGAVLATVDRYITETTTVPQMLLSWTGLVAHPLEHWRQAARAYNPRTMMQAIDYAPFRDRVKALLA